MKSKMQKNNCDCSCFEDRDVDKSRRDFIKKASIVTMVGSSAFILEACGGGGGSPTAPDPGDNGGGGNGGGNGGGGNTGYNYDPNTQTITIDITLIYTSLQNTGSGIALSSSTTFDSRGIIVLRTGSSSVRALSRRCTHAGSIVNINSSSNNLLCPSHNSIFDLNGNVISGPANSSLTRYNASINAEGTIITIKASA